MIIRIGTYPSYWIWNWTKDSEICTEIDIS